MSQQGERNTRHEDDWWGQLYDAEAEDTGPVSAGDSVDDRFASAANTVAEPTDAPDPPRPPSPSSDPPRNALPSPPPDFSPAAGPASGMDPVPSMDPMPGRGPVPGSDRRGLRDPSVEDDPTTRFAVRDVSGPARDVGSERPSGPLDGLGPAPEDEATTRFLLRDDLDPGFDDDPPSVFGTPTVFDTPHWADARSASGMPPAAREPAADPPHGPPSPPVAPPAVPTAPPVPSAPAVPSARGEERGGRPVARDEPAGDPAPAVTPPSATPAPRPPAAPGEAPWEPPVGPRGPRTFPSDPPPAPTGPAPSATGPAHLEDRQPPEAEASADGPQEAAPVRAVPYVGDGPPTYDAEPTALPEADPADLAELVADTVLDGAQYGSSTLRAVSVRGDSARFRGEPRRDCLLTARFGSGEHALVLVAMATGARAGGDAHRAAAEACERIGMAVGRSHARLAEDIRAGRRGDLKSGLQRLTDRSLGKLRARADELGVAPEEYTATLRCLLLSGDSDCRTRVFFGVGSGGLFRLRDGAWQDIEPHVAETSGGAVLGFGSPAPETPEGDRLTMDLAITTPPTPYEPAPRPSPAAPFLFRASVARPGDTLLLCTGGLAEPLRGEPALAGHLTARWAGSAPPGLASFLADMQVRVKGYADDRTAAVVWEA